MPHRLLAVLVLLGALAAVPPAARAANDPSFNLVNRAGVAVREVYVTPAGDANWGRNRLHGTLAPGASFGLQRRSDGNCLFDIKVVFVDGRSEERRGLNTCTLDAVAVGGPEQKVDKTEDDPSFRLVNRGAETIAELYATPAGLAGWGHNRLPPDGVPAGTASVIRIARVATGNCLFDLRVVFADHKAVEKRRADLCRITDLPVP